MLEDITNLFWPDCKINGVTQLSIGHIHKTFLINIENHGDFIAQNFNNQVFPKLEIVIKNTAIITDCLEKDSNYTLDIALPIKSINNRFIEYDNLKTPWRFFTAVKDSISIDQADSLDMIFIAAKSFAQFQKALSSLDPSKIEDPIDGYMDNPARLIKFKNALSEDPLGRSSEITREIEFIETNKDLFNLISKLRNSSSLKVTHGDMKLNNCLFSKDLRSIKAIIDLDTCMVGDYLYDYADFCRFACATAKEDELDLSKVEVNIEYLKCAESGFIEGFQGALTYDQRTAFTKAAASLSLTIGVRFLTDYLIGDKYFSISYPEHNLVRGRNQLKLALEFLNLD